MHKQLHIYADMDGFLVKYDRNAYIGDDPLYMRKGFHYYRDLEPDEKAVKVLKLLHDQGTPITVMPRVSNHGILYTEQVMDKEDWLNRYVKFIDTKTQFLPVASDKRDILALFSRPDAPLITLNHILIDDFNPNLEGWSKEGGTALKYCNGINSPNASNPVVSYKGINLTEDMTAEEIVELINMIPKTTCMQVPEQPEIESKSPYKGFYDVFSEEEVIEIVSPRLTKLLASAIQPKPFQKLKIDREFAFWRMVICELDESCYDNYVKLFSNYAPNSFLEPSAKEDIQEGYAYVPNPIVMRLMTELLHKVKSYRQTLADGSDIIFFT